MNIREKFREYGAVLETPKTQLFFAGLYSLFAIWAVIATNWLVLVVSLVLVFLSVATYFKLKNDGVTTTVVKPGETYRVNDVVVSRDPVDPVV